MNLAELEARSRFAPADERHRSGRCSADCCFQFRQQLIESRRRLVKGAQNDHRNRSTDDLLLKCEVAVARNENVKSPVYHSEERAVRLSAYTILSNHFHLVATSDKEDAVSLFMMDVNGQYAAYRNRTHNHTGRVWQGRVLI